MNKPKTLLDISNAMIHHLAGCGVRAIDGYVNTQVENPRQFVGDLTERLRAMELLPEGTPYTMHACEGFNGFALSCLFHGEHILVVNPGVGTNEELIDNLCFISANRGDKDVSVDGSKPTALVEYANVLTELDEFMRLLDLFQAGEGLLEYVVTIGTVPITTVGMTQELTTLPYKLGLDNVNQAVDFTGVDKAPRAVMSVLEHQAMLSGKADSLLGNQNLTRPATPQAFQPQRLHPETLTSEQLHHLQALLGLQADEAQALVTLADSLAKGRVESFESSTEESDIAGRLERSIQDHLIQRIPPRLVTFHVDPQDPDPEASIKFLQERILETGSLRGAMAILRVALHNDESYAWSWHCNIAMSMRDQGVDCMAAQRGAANFLQILTMEEDIPGVDTTQFEAYKAIEHQYNEQKASDGQ